MIALFINEHVLSNNEAKAMKSHFRWTKGCVSIFVVRSAFVPRIFCDKCRKACVTALKQAVCGIYRLLNLIMAFL